MTSKQRAFIQYVKRTRPKSVEDLRPRYHARFLDRGAFRMAFTVLGLVIKFPRADKRADNIAHSLAEVRAVHRMLHDPKLRALKRYAPSILYHDRRGIVIMPKYKAIEKCKYFLGFSQTFKCLVFDLLPEMRFDFDNHKGNFALAPQGYVLLDAGLLGEIV